jgi:predicted Zn-ribbon and HTH transcriptional regulator
MNIQLQVYKYTCAKCNHAFNALELPGDSYGYFLVRNQSGDIALLPAIEMCDYKQVSEILSAHPKLKSLDRFKRAELLQDIFGDTCDLSPDRTPYKINLPPKCPSCGSNSMANWESIDPPEFMIQDIPVVTNLNWSEMNDNEKRQALDAALARQGF